MQGGFGEADLRPFDRDVQKSPDQLEQGSLGRIGQRLLSKGDVRLWVLTFLSFTFLTTFMAELNIGEVRLMVASVTDNPAEVSFALSVSPKF
jgi:hypothetical protein